ncbi:hypothetical protein DFH06DRAFT_1334386 [Mycena polygramma]|nr:hypothetical protein DFH06DRAFT_1334386 [Mycena polygramma]
MDPPAYDEADIVLRDLIQDDDLPAYSRPPTPPLLARVDRTPKEYRYEIKSRGSSSPWAVLTVQGDPVLSRKAMPMIAQGSNLAGAVRLDLRSVETVQAVCILIKGEVVDAGSGLAYQENSPLLGPDADPEGWKTQSLSVKGQMFASRELEATCTFSLATPLADTRSASIPCAMRIETTDLQALDLPSAPTASIVYLQRSTHNELSPEIPKVCGQAVFWPSTEGSPANAGPRQRHQLMGEIHLRPTLQPYTTVPGIVAIEVRLPSFHVFMWFKVEYSQYSVVVFPFQAAGFKPSENVPILRQAVEIMTRHAPGAGAAAEDLHTHDVRDAQCHRRPVLSRQIPRVHVTRS